MVRARQSTFSLENLSWRTTSSLENLDWMFPFLNIWHNFLLNEFQKPPLTFLGEVDCFKKIMKQECLGFLVGHTRGVSRGFLVRHARGVNFFSLSKSVFLFETLAMTNVNEKRVMFTLFQTRILMLKLETSTILALFGVWRNSRVWQHHWILSYDE